MRLDKYLADMGEGKRSELKKQIRQGQVSVNGEVIRDPGYAVSAADEVLIAGRAVQYEEFVYYMMNKPAGVISATEDDRQETVLDLLQGTVRRDVFPVGRLDRDTEGLLLLTNDGQLAHRLLAPARHVDKVYYARVTGPLAEDAAERFRNGLRVDDTLTARPAELKILRSFSDGITETEVTIREGKFHQVKRMFRAVGAEVVFLKRLRMGPLCLDPELPPGGYRRLTQKELAALKEC